ncbi:MAG TPA: DsbE family thiol:disulfide interchange protein [Candidatus Sulfotelmatobacter sp.]|jgi:DsbE subfamily thiol:disulfide oxidoreductase|nr:DsbE family thiol:disulfide interchange protein [Candidatus Sulfotelmatobacter sp.]
MRPIALLPVAVFLVLAGFFGYRLLLIDKGDAPNFIPSVMVDKPAPDFDLPPLFDGKSGLKTADLQGKVTLINFFASWCVPCRAEHQLLSTLSGKGFVLVGVNYKDKPEDAKAWLGRLGDPYDVLVADRQGQTGIDFGVYGVPESYLIDRQGRIRFKQTGPFTPETIEKDLLPRVAELNK